jgi:hypothetical protein
VSAPRRESLSVPLPLAALSWVLAGWFSFLGAALGSSALQSGQEAARPALAVTAAGCVLLATYLALVAAASLPRGPESLRQGVRTVLGAIAAAGLLVATVVFFAAAPGGIAFDDSWPWAIAATSGIWTALTALAPLGRRRCWQVVGAACTLLLLGSVAVTIWDGR